MGATLASDERIAAARQYINEQIGDRLNFNDSIALARLDVRIESLQEERQHYEAVQVLEDERSRTDQPKDASRRAVPQPSSGWRWE